MENNNNPNELWGNFWKDSLNKENKSSIFIKDPPTVKDFLNNWVHSPLFKRQENIVNLPFTNDGKNLTTDHNEYVLAYGKRAGKDTCIALTIGMLVTWLLHLKNPQKYLSIKDGDPIDIVNCAFDEDQAETVFFEKLKRTVRETIDPITGKNFFEGLGMDINKAVQGNKIFFPKNIRAFSLNCLPYETPIKTRVGYQLLGKLVKNKIQTEVYSYNLKENRFEWKPILNWFETKELNINWYKIEFDYTYSPRYRGKNLICTSDHKIYTRRGWVEAQNLKTSDIVLNERKSPSENQKQILYGGLLGDCAIANNTVKFYHSIKQANYLYSKYKVLKNLGVSPLKRIKSSNSYGKSGGTGFTIKAMEILKTIPTLGINRFELLLPKLTPLGFATWYMDDGSLTKSNQVTLALPPISKETELFILNKLKKYEPKVARYYKKNKATILSFTVKGSKKFLGMICHYIPNSMQYKLTPEFKNKNTFGWNIENSEATKIKIKKIFPHYTESYKDKNGWNKTNFSKTKKYCIEVGDNNNFFANGILVSNSVKFKAEGKNIVFAIFDEIAQFRFDRAEAIRKHIKSSAKGTSLKYHKLFYISFLTSGNDYMAHLLDLADKSGGGMYSDVAASWEIRSEKDCPIELKDYVVHKSDFQDEYDEDPESAMLMYECKIPKVFANSFIKQPQRILDCIGKIDEENFRSSPIIEPENPWSYNPLEEEFEPWFKPYMTEYIWKLQQEYEKNPSNALEEKIRFEKEIHLNGEYYVHLDLSRGVVDCASIGLAHKYRVLDQSKLYLDLMLQIRADKTIDKNAEIDMTQLLDFVIKILKNKLKFSITNLTADGWNSALFFNICEKESIPCELVSLEKNTIPYETLKTFIYSNNINIYPYQPLIRELTELLIENKKVNHPRKSQWRMKEEGLPLGSKDCADSAGGLAYSATKDEDEGSLSFGSA